MGKIINGIIVQQFINGWWGENNEGNILLHSLGLPADTLPFDVEQLLNTGEFVVFTSNKIVIKVTINKQDTYFEFMCKWPDKKYCFKLFRNWDGIEIDTIIKMESYAVGECVRKIITNKSIL